MTDRTLAFSFRRTIICSAAMTWLQLAGAAGAFAQAASVFVGRAVLPDGSPAAGVVVTADFQGAASQKFSATSGPDGAFSISTTISQQEAVVRVESATYGDSSYLRYPSPAAGKTSNPIEIRMSGTVSVHGRVVDPAGKPVAGVQVSGRGHSGGVTLVVGFPDDTPVRAEPAKLDPSPAPSPTPGYGVTDADGRFSLGVFALPGEGKPLQVAVLPPRPLDLYVSGIPRSIKKTDAKPPFYQAQMIERPAAKHGDSIDLAIQLVPVEPIVFEGTVRDSQGNPVPGAAVKAFAGHPSRDWIEWIFPNMNAGPFKIESRPVPVAMGVTGPDGHYRIEALKDDASSIEAQWGGKPLPGYSISIAADPQRTALSPRFEPAPTEHEHTVDLALPTAEEASTITGRAIDPDGNPLAGIELIESRLGVSATTGPDGRFRMQFKPSPSAAGIGGYYLPRSGQRIQLEPADKAWRVVYPKPADRFSNHLGFEELREAGALLVLTKQAPSPSAAPDPSAPGSRSSSTGGSGRQRSMPPGSNATAHLQVVTPEGKPLPGYRVGNGNGFVAITDEDGPTDIRLDPSRAIMLYINAPENGEGSWMISPAVHDARVDSSTLVIGGEPSASGIVRYRGVPQPNIGITLATADGGIVASGSTGPDGKFAIDGIPAGPANLMVRTPGIPYGPTPSREIVVGPASQGLEIELPAPDLILHFPKAAAGVISNAIRIVNLDDPDRGLPSRGVPSELTETPVYGLIPGLYLFELETSGFSRRLIGRLGPIAFKKAPEPLELTIPAEAGD